MNQPLANLPVTESCSQMLCNLLDQTQDNGSAILSMVDRYIQYFSRIYCNLDFSDQQDIHQEVALKLFCHGEKVRDSCTKAWVYTVVRNQCINHVHQRNGKRSVVMSTGNPELKASKTGSAHILNKHLETGLLDELDCLDRIFDVIEAEKTGKADINLYTLYAFGLSYVEISERSKRTVGAIGQRISVLKKQLSKLVVEYC